jgi:PTH1 family peptidyl-tRNA hydrolase
LRTVFGIGNPGHHYAANRHNVGFLILDYYASKKKIEFSPSKGEYFQASGSIGEIKFLLIKPTTYVNRSGIAAKEVFDSHNLEPEDILVICDDTNLNTGTLRVRLAGGDGGHNGLASLADFVLSDFNENEIRKLQPAFENTILLIEEFISGGSKAMLDLNSKLSLDDRDNTNNL